MNYDNIFVDQIFDNEHLSNIELDTSIISEKLILEKEVCCVYKNDIKFYLFKNKPTVKLINWISNFDDTDFLVGQFHNSDVFYETIKDKFSDKNDNYSQQDIKQSENNTESFLSDILKESFSLGASDIHFENKLKSIIIKVRLDGVLITLKKIENKKFGEQLISRLKVLANLDIAEQRIPQDGRLSTFIDIKELDLRISIMPGLHGEDAVLRILDKSNLVNTISETISLENLGFKDNNLEIVKKLAKSPYGMILFTGPTGSGKTTSLYALLNENNNGYSKIITVEDPIEYQIENALQIPVNEKKGLTFAKGLRSILRHDPDTILIGEIRDKETAEIAIQASLTGHLVYTSVHANNALDVIGRFKHMNIDMYGFLSCLNGVIAQRLIRTKCKYCMAQITEKIGCEECHFTGFKGRKAIMEIMMIDDYLREMILENQSIKTIRTYLKKNGMRTLREEAIEAVNNNETTMDEINRVTHAESF
ncbi:GspE/PulE family protein [Acinetobacter sp. IRS14]|uniref:GspE/PulE family protein n=1 Tax=Acinetobacter sp. IRS14 TaxID=2983398 RepID=UPI002AFF9E31|nr:GspE/PulE family protein [Acinetobacter sp. IRS14]MEA1230306.1 GspE/PulE family protein [Acinetobacter sp. IRS14]